MERASELASSFEHIICTGVLHHLSSPEGGLRALHDVLEPEGAMHLMVYAPYGRAGVYMLQEYCRRLGIGTSSEEIRALAATTSSNVGKERMESSFKNGHRGGGKQQQQHGLQAWHRAVPIQTASPRSDQYTGLCSTCSRLSRGRNCAIIPGATLPRSWR